MASIVNRSNYLVTVEGKPERTMRFPFTNSRKQSPKCNAKICREFDRCLFCGFADDEVRSLHVY